MTVKAYNAWPTNAHLIEDVARLGYLRKGWRTLDPTYGEGTFWRRWRPEVLVTADINGRADIVADFTELPFPNESFDCVVFDPPYKLNGTPSKPDARYGVHNPTPWRARMALIEDGLRECARVCSGNLLVKCQDQVCSGKVRWQSTLIAKRARYYHFGLVDRFDMLGGRAQPEGRRQVHARRNASTLLVFRRGWDSE